MSSLDMKELLEKEKFFFFIINIESSESENWIQKRFSGLKKDNPFGKIFIRNLSTYTYTNITVTVPTQNLALKLVPIRCNFFFSEC